MPVHEKVDKAAAAASGTTTAKAAAPQLSNGSPRLPALEPGRATVAGCDAAASAGPRGRPRSVQRLSAANLLTLQRSVGNSAATHLVQRTPCSCASCGCTKDDDQSAPTEPAVVQRLGVADIAGAVLPEWVNNLVVGVPAKARSLVGTVTGGTAAMDREVAGDSGQAARKITTDTDRQTRSSEASAESESKAAEATATTTDERAAKEAARGDAAASALPSVGPLVGPLVNPAMPTLDMDVVRQAADRAGKLLQAVPEGAAQLRSDIERAVQDGTAADGQPGWNCDQAEVMAMVGGVKRAVADAAVRAGKAVLGEDRYNRLAAFVEEQIAAVRKTVAAIRAGIDKVIDALTKEWERRTKPLVDAVNAIMKMAAEKWAKFVADVRRFMDLAIAGAKIVWEAIEKRVIKPFIAKVGTAKQSIEDAVKSAIAALGSWWGKLPPWAQKGLLVAAAIVAGPVGLALAAAYKAAEFLMANKDRIITRIRAEVDRAVSAIGTWYQKARKVLERVIAKIQELGRRMIELARKAAAKAAAFVDQHTPKWVKDLRAAAERMRQKIAGKVCTALGETAGPCVEQFVPDIGPNPTPGASHDITVQATGELAALVYGVPVKVGSGASVTLSRAGKVYTVVVSGEGSVGVSTEPLAGGGGGSDVKVELPGNLGKAQKAWAALTGKQAPASGTPATPAASPGVAPSPGGVPSVPGLPTPGTVPGAAPKKDPVSAEAGYKGKFDMTYVFDGGKEGADSTCDGVGGMTAMLAGLGLGALVPPPFNALGGGLQGDYSSHLVACTVTLSQYGNVKVDLKNEGGAGIEAAVTGEAGVTLGRARKTDEEGKPTDEWVDTATIFGSISGSLAGDLLLNAEPPIKLGAKATASGRISASLAYNEKTGVIEAMTVSGTASFGLGLSLPEISDILPEPIAGAVSKALAPYLTVAKGTVEATASVSFNNLHILLGAIDQYVAANGERSTSQGLIDLVIKHFSEKGNLTTSLSVVLKVSESFGKVSATASGKGASGKAEISITENQTIPLYPVAAPLPAAKS